MKKIPTASNENRQPKALTIEIISKFMAIPACEPTETTATAVVERYTGKKSTVNPMIEGYISPRKRP